MCVYIFYISISVSFFPFLLPSFLPFSFSAPLDYTSHSQGLLDIIILYSEAVKITLGKFLPAFPYNHGSMPS